MGFSRQEYWNGLPFSSPGDLPNSGIELGSPALQADGVLLVKNPPINAGSLRDAGSISGLRRSPGGGHGNPLQYSLKYSVIWVIQMYCHPGFVVPFIEHKQIYYHF